MARIKTKRLPAAAAADDDTADAPCTQNPNQNETQIQNPNENEEDQEEEEGEDPSSPLVPRLASAIALSLRFLSDSDLLLSSSQSLALSSLLRASAAKLSAILAQTNQIPNLPPDLHAPPPKTLTPFPWFRRFLASSTSPSDPRWPDNFRMSKPSFYLLLQTLSPSLLSNSTSPVPPDVKLAAALFRLAHAAPFPFIARRFGLNSPSLAARAFYESLRAVADRLGHLFELASDTTRILQGFNWMSLPNCCGALAFSRFGGGGVIGQCLVDSEGRFLDASVGWHPSMGPAEILSKTKLYTAQAVVLGGDAGAPVPRYFIGGSCCPLLPWLLTPYQESDTGRLRTLRCTKGAVFNTVHARGMELAERAFMRLKARWKLLRMEWTEECVGALPYVVVASCLLHNYLVKCSEPAVEDGEGCVAVTGFDAFEGEVDAEGERIRDVLAAHLSQKSIIAVNGGSGSHFKPRKYSVCTDMIEAHDEM